LLVLLNNCCRGFLLYEIPQNGGYARVCRRPQFLYGVRIDGKDRFLFHTTIRGCYSRGKRKENTSSVYLKGCRRLSRWHDDRGRRMGNIWRRYIRNWPDRITS